MKEKIILGLTIGLSTVFIPAAFLLGVKKGKEEKIKTTKSGTIYVENFEGEPSLYLHLDVDVSELKNNEVVSIQIKDITKTPSA